MAKVQEVRHKQTYAEVDVLSGRMPLNNRVMVRIENGDIVTNSGLHVPNRGEWGLNAGLHVERVGVVALPVESLMPMKTVGIPQGAEDGKKAKDEGNRLDWGTDNELEVGDEVLFDHMEGLNAPMVRESSTGNFYRIIHYRGIIAYRRGGVIVPVNGYVLFSDFKNRETALEYGGEVVDKTKGVVRHVGIPNRGYIIGKRTDEGVDVKVGDVVVFNKRFYNGMRYYVEDPMHWKFSKEPLFCSQRHWIDYVM